MAESTDLTQESSESAFAWEALLADKLLGKDKDGKHVVVPASSLNGKYVALYFSAHWCPPCRAFTPRLASTYKSLQEAGKDVEFVFVSMDKDQASFDEYFDSMPWLAVPFQDDQLRSVLSRKFRVQGIPQLSIMAPDSTIICENARAAVATDPEGRSFPWKGMDAPRSPPMPWIFLALIVFWILSTFVLPKYKKS